MKKRIITGVCVALFWIALLAWAPTWCMFPVLLAATLACVWEYCGMLKRAGMEASRKFLMVAGVAWLAWCYAFPIYTASELSWYQHYLNQNDPDAFFDFAIAGLVSQGTLMLLVAGLFALFLRVLFAPKIKRPLEMLGTTLLGFFYAPFMLGFFIRLAQWGAKDGFEISREGIFLAAFLALVVKAGDTGAYAAGMAFGRHKMFPRISPKKSWEGLIGGLALSAVASVGFVWFAQNVFPAGHFSTLRQFSLLEAAVAGVFLCGVGVLGDLVESQLKRATDIKDSGGMFPGMGGLLDMFDSLIFAAPAFYFYLLLFHA